MTVHADDVRRLVAAAEQQVREIETAAASLRAGESTDDVALSLQVQANTIALAQVHATMILAQNVAKLGGRFS